MPGFADGEMHGAGHAPEGGAGFLDGPMDLIRAQRRSIWRARTAPDRSGSFANVW